MADYSTDIYLQKKSLAETRDILLKSFKALSPGTAETVFVPEAVGMVLSEGVFAEVSSPASHVSAMDGIAVKAEKTFGAAETSPMILKINKDAFFVNTGNLIPPETNAVIMIEDVNVIDDEELEIMASAFPWQYVRRAGEDIVATELLLPAGHRITPYCVGALLTAGIMEVAVKKQPCVMIIPTGDELLECGRDFDPKTFAAGRVLETNSHTLGALIEGCGASFVRHEILPDDIEKIKKTVKEAAESKCYDAVMILGGSSAGAKDYSKQVISELGTLLIHGVTIMPGKPFIAGDVHGVPVFGMPGYPVSAVVCFEELVKPFLLSLQNNAGNKKDLIPAMLTKKVASKLGIEEFLRVRLGDVGGQIVATPLPRGAGSVTSLADADAFVRIPADTEGLAETSLVDAESLGRVSDFANTLVLVGSHDNTLDVIADMIGQQNGNMRVASSHVGSMGGLMALKKGYCHAAGSHLFDPDSETYNISYIKKYLPDFPVKIVRLVSRSQGLMVAPGNPKTVGDLEDLSQEGICFINRQPGSGTRILLDYRLSELGLDGTAISGYENEEYTHMAVAAAVASGVADAGLGIYAAARALGLDFIPVVTEQYDLVISEKFFDLPVVQELLDIIKSPDFAARVKNMGGYGVEETGSVIPTLP